MALSEAEIRRYHEQGYLFPIRVLSAEAAAGYRRRLEGAEAESDEIKRLLRNKPHLLLTFLDELVRHPAVLDAVEGVIGPNIFCWASSFFTKEPRTTDFISWHQDLTYWGLEPADIVTAWIALSPSTPESGCMRVVAGTHTQEVVAHKDTFGEHNMLSRGQEIAVEVDEDHAVDVVLQPGEMSLHHVKLFHGSKPNRSADRRIGFAVRYLPTYVRQTVGEKDSALLVRGVDAYGHFEHETPPAADLDPAALAHHKAVCERQAQILFRGTDRAGAR
ncbi:MAG TPA: phytanoyl-CoA dioxygenase family protein [Microvirga sp.]|nr:phytanoyl-CoA dioxygenase family protein [Microvirga sp.]